MDYSPLFANPAAAVNFMNVPPAQRAEEAVFSVRENGQTHVFIFLCESSDLVPVSPDAASGDHGGPWNILSEQDSRSPRDC